MRITEQEVQRVAQLANLALTGEEVAKMAQDMSGILTHIDKLNELDTSDVEPMSQVMINDVAEMTMLREDIEKPSLSNEDAVANAPVTSGGYFKVPRVIER